jgi:hypothetical protein
MSGYLPSFGAQVAIDRHLDELAAQEDSDSETCRSCGKRDYRCDMLPDALGWQCAACDDHDWHLMADV